MSSTQLEGARERACEDCTADALEININANTYVSVNENYISMQLLCLIKVWKLVLMVEFHFTLPA